MKTFLRTVLLMGLASAATYVVVEWSLLQKSGVHDLRVAAPVELLPVPDESQRLLLQAQMVGLEQTLGEYRAMQERMIAEFLERIARIEARVAQLAAQRVPVPAVAAVPAASRPVRWASAMPAVPVPNLATLAREAGFTNVQVRP